jgi:gamma-glutamyltranspeptidase/glutathione hydrolase
MRILAIATATLLIATASPVGQTRPGGQDFGVPAAAGVVVSATDVASDIGAAILSRGGNAVDAAVATALALAVTYPFAGNIGGGGFMIVRTPDGRATAFDYREKAPLKATPTMYLNEKGEIDRSLTAAGYLAPGVPGTVRGMALAHQRFGKLPWRDVVQPAVEVASNGFLIPASLARGLNSEVRGAMSRFPASVDAYGARRRPVESGRSPLAAGSGENPQRHLRESGRVLHRLDCRPHCRRHGEQRRPDFARGSGGLQSRRARASQGHVPGLRHRFDAAAELGRHGAPSKR